MPDAIKPPPFKLFAIAVSALLFVMLSGMVGTRIIAPTLGWGDGYRAADEPAALAQQFVRFDSGYYVQIARDGYAIDGNERAFFPLYPLIVRGVTHITFLPIFVSGLLVSTFCFIAACWFLYHWISLDYSEEIAQIAVIWMAVFPLAFFFFAFYAEPLYLLTGTAALYFVRRGHFIASGIAIALAGATRSQAFLLAIPYAVEFWQQNDYRRERWTHFVMGGLIAPVGTLSYLLYLSVQSDNSNLWTVYASLHATEWQRSFTLPWVTLTDGFKAAIWGKGVNADWFNRALVVHDLGYAVFGMGAAIWSLFHIRLSSALFMFGSMVFFYTNHGPYGYAFWSLPRHIALLFPLYLVLALWSMRLPSSVRWLLLLLSVGLLGLFAGWFASGRWVA